MKKAVLALTIICILLIPITAFASDAEDHNTGMAETKYTGEYEEMVEEAINVLAEAWNDIYSHEEFYPNPDYLLDIRNTRIVCIKDMLDEKQAEYFGDVKYIIEFILFDEYIPTGVSGYYGYSGMNDNVLVYKDGSMECTSRFLNGYRSRTFDVDFSTFIDQVIDLREEYNQVIRFRDHQVIKEQ